MLESMKSFFREKMELPHPQTDKAPSAERAIQIATCAILLEAALADNELSKEELDHIHGALRHLYSIEASDIEQLVEITRMESREAIDIWQFTNLINQNYDTEQKMLVMEHVWRVILADSTLDKFEDYIARKLQPLLRLEHKQWIEAKKRAKSFLNGQSQE